MYSSLLGNTIKFKADDNPILNGKTFYVLYMDDDKMKIVGVSGAEVGTGTDETDDDAGVIHTLFFTHDEDYKEGDDKMRVAFQEDAKIQSIEIVLKNPHIGYAKQHNLVLGKWVIIQFAGSHPYTLKGPIVEVVEDMIVIHEYVGDGNGDFFYIDFQYHGLPEELNIENIQIISPPADILAKITQQKEEEQEQIETQQIEYDARFPEQKEDPNSERIYIKQIEHDLNNIIFGEKLDVVLERIEITDNWNSYIRDYKDAVMADIPISKRTDEYMETVDLHIQRMKELRELFSTYDTEQGNIIGKKRFGAFYKPLLYDILPPPITTMTTRVLPTPTQFPMWMKPVVYSGKKIYDTVGDNKDGSTVLTENQIDEYSNEINYIIINDEFANEKLTIPNEPYKIRNERLQKEGAPIFPMSFVGGTDIQQPPPPLKIYDIKQNNISFIETIVNNNYDNIYNNKNNSVLYDTTKKSTTPLKNTHNYIQKFIDNEKLAIRSLVVLPMSFLLHSTITRPAVSLLSKSCLNQSQPMLFSYEDTPYIKKIIEEREAGGASKGEGGEAGADGTNWIIKKTVKEGARPPLPYSNLTEYVMSSSLLKAEVGANGGEGEGGGGVRADLFEKYLRKILPSTDYVIQLMSFYYSLFPSKTRIYIPQLSFLHYVKPLEPFSIYPKHIGYSSGGTNGSASGINKHKSSMEKITQLLKYGIMNKLALFKTHVHGRNFLLGSYDTKKHIINANTIPTDRIIPFLFSTPEANLLKHRLKVDIENVYQDEGDGRGEGGADASLLTLQEQLLLMTKTDYGLMFYMTIANYLSSLYIPEIINTTGSVPLSKRQQSNATNEDTPDCSTRFLTKIYKTVNKLNEDDGVADIYYDRELDDTPYDLLKLYKNEKDTYTPAKYKEFLTVVMEKKHDIPIQYIDEIVEALIEGRKRVKKGEYALLYTAPPPAQSTRATASAPPFILYRRAEGNIWVKAGGTDGDIGDLQKIGQENQNRWFCNVSNSCMKTHLFCENKDIIADRFRELAKKKFEREATAMMLGVGATDELVDLNIEEHKTTLENWLRFYEKTAKQKRILQFVKKHRKDFIANEIGELFTKNHQHLFLTAENATTEEEKRLFMDKQLMDKYVELRDLILVEADFNLKQQHIYKLVVEKCRNFRDIGASDSAGTGTTGTKESPHWKYCRETNAPYIPTSLFLLAETWVQNKNNDAREQDKLYKKELERQCRLVGERVGDAIVDKYTHFELRKTEYVAEGGGGGDGGDGDGDGDGGGDVENEHKQIFMPATPTEGGEGGGADDEEEQKGADGAGAGGVENEPDLMDIEKVWAMVGTAPPPPPHAIVGTTTTDADELEQEINRIQNPSSRWMFKVLFMLCNELSISLITHPQLKKQTLQLCEEIVPLFLINKTVYMNAIDVAESKFAVSKKSDNDAKENSYKKHFYQNIVYVVSVCFYITLQTITPPLSFYKIKSNLCGKMTGKIDYFACVLTALRKASSSFEPWSQLFPLKAIGKKYSDTAKHELNRIFNTIETHETVRRLFNHRKEYDMLFHPDAGVGGEGGAGAEQWTHFYPPLIVFKIENIAPLTTAPELLLKQWNNGEKLQRKAMLEIKTRARQYMFSVVEQINAIVKTHPMIMTTSAKNEPYLVNACCNDMNLSVVPMKYFIDYAKSGSGESGKGALEKTLETVKKLNDIMDINERLETSPFIKPTTKGAGAGAGVGAPTQPFNYADLYALLIQKYCHLDDDLPIPPIFLPFLQTKIADYSRHMSANDKRLLIQKAVIKGDQNAETLYYKFCMVLYKQNIITTSTTGVVATTQSPNNNNNTYSIYKTYFNQFILIQKQQQHTQTATATAIFQSLCNPDIIYNTLRFETFLNIKLTEIQEIHKTKQYNNNTAVLAIYGQINKLLAGVSSIETTNHIKRAIYELLFIYPQLITATTETINDCDKTAPPKWKLTFEDNNKIIGLFENQYQHLLALKPRKMSKNKIEKQKEMFRNCQLWFWYLIHFPYVVGGGDDDEDDANNTPPELLNELKEIKRSNYIILHKLIFQIIIDELLYTATTSASTNEDTTADTNTNNSPLNKTLETIKVFLNYELKKKEIKTIDYERDIKQKIEILKYEEKKRLMDYFTNMTDEERQTEKMLKQFKLGKWFVEDIHIYGEKSNEVVNRHMGGINEIVDITQPLSQNESDTRELGEDARNYGYEYNNGNEDGDDYGDNDNDN